MAGLLAGGPEAPPRHLSSRSIAASALTATRCYSESPRRLSMNLTLRWACLGMVAFTVAVGPISAPVASAQETPRMGGVLKVASIGEPPTLDIPMSTATLVYEIMSHVNE